LLLVVASFLVAPSRAATPDVVRRLVGTLTGTVTRTYRVPDGALLAGVTWRSGDVSAAVLRDGRWEALERGDDEPGSRPGTEPVGVERLLVLRMSGRAEGVAVEFAGGGSSSAAPAVAPRRIPRLGDVVTRRGWGADERLRSGRVKYTTPAALVVHHTVTANDYPREKAASYVRAVYAYHTRSRGWSDIGYNLLVDRFGTVYEGRYGDFTRGVVGSHTANYNANTIGVALVGNFDTVALPPATQDAVARAGAWASEHWRFDPRATVRLRGRTVSRMPGHRDLGTTACPGRYTYAALPALRKAAWHKLAPVFGRATVNGAPLHSPRPVTVSASLDAPAYWTATIYVRDTRLAVASGRGRTASVAWDGTLDSGLPAPPGTYDYVLTADDRVHGASAPVSGTFEVGLPALVSP
jgi:uncharacterized protein with LGFP repeats